MKTLMFGWEFPPYNSGGLGVACRGLARGLTKHGVAVTFVLPRKIPLRVPWCRLRFADEGVPCKGMADGRLLALHSYRGSHAWRAARHRHACPHAPPCGSSILAEALRYGVLARGVALEEPHEVIHAHDWLSFPAGIAAKEASGKPLVAHVHATEFDRTGGSVNRAVYDIERVGVHAADMVIAVSHYTKNILVRHYGVPPEKVAVVHNAIDHDDEVICRGTENLFHALKDKGRRIVLFVGRLTLQKGADYFLRAAKMVAEADPRAVFVISGSGDMEQQLMQEAAYEGIGDRVFFVGFLRGPLLARLYGLAEVVVMPSVSEPFGIVPLEALHNGTPVIISKQSGVAEVLRHALRVDFWDTREMANQIIALLRHPELHRVLRDQGREEVRALVWKKAAEQCKLVYHRAVALWRGAPAPQEAPR